MAKERGVPLGKEVGYQIRFVNKACESTKLIYATTAIILRRLHSDPELGNIGCLIVDEVLCFYIFLQGPRARCVFRVFIDGLPSYDDEHRS